MPANEVLRLAIALLATPLILSVARRIGMSEVLVPFSVAYAGMVTAYATSLAHTVWPLAGFDVLSHVCYLVSGVGMLVVALIIRQWALRRRRLVP